MPCDVLPNFALDMAGCVIKLHAVTFTRNMNHLTVSDPTVARKARFRAALALTGLTAAEWAVRNGITAGHLSQVLAGKRESRSLEEKVDAFADRYITAA